MYYIKETKSNKYVKGFEFSPMDRRNLTSVYYTNNKREALFFSHEEDIDHTLFRLQNYRPKNNFIKKEKEKEL